MILAQISDLHIKPQRRLAYGVVDTASMLEKCVASLLKLKQRPDAIIATGDLVDLGRPDEYGLLREILAPLSSFPLYLLAGNHDERAALRAAFPDHDYLRQWEPFLQYAIEDHALRIVGLDTVIPGQGGGELCPERLDWLDRTLARSDRPTVVALHHPPFITGIGHMDRVCLADTDALKRVLVRHPQVTRLIAGHLHRPITCELGGTVVSVCPSPAHLVALDLSVDAPDNFVMEPPGFQLHLQTASGLVTHTAYIGEFAGPYPFRQGGRLID
ncbi:MAG TPA: phosphodiesterase [Burkholderiaceae bacterium]|nr:phosphodiesterase [Burkholderiaceae bacterium]